MVKIVELEDAKNPNFIGCWMLENDSLSDGIVDFFEANPAKHKKGYFGADQFDPSTKLSTDLNIFPNDLEKDSFKVISEYVSNLKMCYLAYLEKWEFLNTFFQTAHIGTFNIQKYDVGGHFNKLHSERMALNSSHRVLAWMTYLNDVSDGGATEFPYFDLKVTPEKGKTLIWPAEWTHAHRGCMVKKGPKYIITGWMNFSS